MTSSTVRSLTGSHVCNECHGDIGLVPLPRRGLNCILINLVYKAGLQNQIRLGRGLWLSDLTEGEETAGQDDERTSPDGKRL